MLEEESVLAKVLACCGINVDILPLPPKTKTRSCKKTWVFLWL